jgi:biofilm PGA synthesis lipoprotein PgaB
MAPLLTWDELREVKASGLVEILSHSHALHRHDVANPQGLTAPAISSRLYFAELGRYENRDEYRDRILADLLRSRARLREELGVETRVLAWPYGEHNDLAREIAREAGFTSTLGLEGARVIAEDVGAGYCSRLLVVRNEDIGAPDMTWLYPGHEPMRPAEVDLDDLYDADADRLLENVEGTIEELATRRVTDVFLSVCADPTGTGFLEEAYFMNHQTRVRADVWSMTAIRMRRAGFRVWARVPALNLAWEWARHPEWRLDAAPVHGRPNRWPFRLSPDLPEVEQAGADFLNDLAVYAPLDGIVFDADTRLDVEDRLQGDPQADSQTKARVLEAYLEHLERTVLAWRPHCEVVRPRRGPEDQFSSSSRETTSTR